jgi:tRNA nucleotidyltransferase (CCA-adding enzyme)
MLVGGAVIGMLQGREPKDWDLEVFGLDYDRVLGLFADFHAKEVGRAFGIVKVTIDGEDIDINLPRKDNKVGAGHRGFEVDVDSNMSVAEAARRRDFTINAMALDLVTGELHDPFGGRADLEAGILRATDPQLFVQDPLRALRAMQLLARKAKTVDRKTLALIRGMSRHFSELPKERLHEEFRKLLLKADRPSVGLAFLRESGWLPHFPELEAMIGCEQREEWHPEGDVWAHSLLAADAAAQVRHLVPDHLREAFVFGTFLHDAGKPATTITAQMIRARDPYVMQVAASAGKDPSDLLLTAYGHDMAGMDPAASFLRKLTDSPKLIKAVQGIVGLHMQPWNLYGGNAGLGAYARLSRKASEFGLPLSILGHVCRCDACATGFNRRLIGGQPDFEHATSERLFDAASTLDQKSSLTPKVQGRDLIARGYKPGPEMGKILKRAIELQDKHPDWTRDDLLVAVAPLKLA